MAHHRALGTDVGIARIFNTYGPRLAPRDGRVVSTFIVQALRGEPLTVYGDGTQTRSLCYVDDLVRGSPRALGPRRHRSGEPRQPSRAHRPRARAARRRCDGLGLDDRPRASCPSTTRLGVGRTSRSPRRCSAGRPRSPWTRASRRTVEHFRSITALTGRCAGHGSLPLVGCTRSHDCAAAPFPQSSTTRSPCSCRCSTSSRPSKRSSRGACSSSCPSRVDLVIVNDGSSDDTAAGARRTSMTHG